MQIDQVPQDCGMAGGLKEVCYAVNEKGRYEMVPSLGWEPKNIANSQALHQIIAQVRETVQRIQNGQMSPLAYHMVRNQMTVGLLAKYVKQFRWKVRRHLTPRGYAAMKSKHKQRYADLFELSIEALDHVPDICC
ncbi:MAG: hypothetical protein WAU91_17865 [Desulfatitalea sp.]